jgi:hypothetical protein
MGVSTYVRTYVIKTIPSIQFKLEDDDGAENLHVLAIWGLEHLDRCSNVFSILTTSGKMILVVVKQLDSVELDEMNQFKWIFLNECISNEGHRFYTL